MGSIVSIKQHIPPILGKPQITQINADGPGIDLGKMCRPNPTQRKEADAELKGDPVSCRQNDRRLLNACRW